MARSKKTSTETPRPEAEDKVALPVAEQTAEGPAETVPESAEAEIEAPDAAAAAPEPLPAEDTLAERMEDEVLADAGGEAEPHAEAADNAAIAEESVPPYAAPPQPAPHSSSGGGFVAGLLGGALAIAAGVGALWLSNPDLLRGEAPKPDLSPLEARLDTQASQIETLNAEVTRLSDTLGAGETVVPGAVEALKTDLTSQLDDLGTEIASVSDTLDMLRGRVAQIEARPVAPAGAATDAAAATLRAELDQQRAEIEKLVSEARSRIENAEAEAERMQQSAESATRSAAAAAALAQVRTALESGAPYAAPLSDLAQNTDTAIPPALIGAADSGVPTLTVLQARFPDAARAALAAAIREDMPADAGTVDRIGAFLRAQTGARSTEPHDGSDPDALLSRAEAALAGGDLSAALTELAALPEAAQAAMSDWQAAARVRLEALEAAEALTAAPAAN